MGAWRGVKFSPLTDLAGILLKDADGLDSELRKRLKGWNALPYGARREAQLQHLKYYLLGITRLCPHYYQTLSGHLKQRHWNWEQFRRLPLSTRVCIQDHGAQMRANRQARAWTPISSTSTSGSTGTPIITEQTPARARLQKQLNRQWHESAGRDSNLGTGFITDPFPGGQAEPPTGLIKGSWGHGGGLGKAHFLTLRASSAEQLAWMRLRELGYLVTYPSNLRALLNESRLTGQRPEDLKEVILSSEPVPRSLVRRAEEEWCVLVTATYSSSELAAIALQDSTGQYRIQDCSVLVEVLNADGTPTKRGEIGKIVVTTLQELLRPLIRYEIGDYAEVDEGEDGELLLKNIVGRQRSMIRHANGTSVWPYFELGELAQTGAVRQWQLIQHRDGALTVLVVAKQLTREDERGIKTAIRSMTGQLPLTIRQVDSIARTPGGKYREVISEIEYLS